MKNLLYPVIAAAMLVSAATGANAATTITFDGQSGTFGNADVGTSPFSDTINFNLTTPGFLSATISNVGAGLANIDFTSVLLNGVAFTLSPTGFVEFGSIVNRPSLSGPQTLTIAGLSGGNAAYSGTLSFVPGAIPEPGVWAMMLAGFGLVGAYSRRTTRVAFA